jgi:hypothetical protein
MSNSVVHPVCVGRRKRLAFDDDQKQNKSQERKKNRGKILIQKYFNRYLSNLNNQEILSLYNQREGSDRLIGHEKASFINFGKIYIPPFLS